MNIEKTFPQYDPIKFGKPWIGKVIAWTEGEKPEIVWGIYSGDDNGGVCTIDAKEGDIIRWGQKLLKESKPNAFWGIVENGGIKVINWKDASAMWFKYHLSKQKVNWDDVTDDELIAEAEKRGMAISQAPDDENGGVAPLDEMPF